MPQDGFSGGFVVCIWKSVSVQLDWSDRLTGHDHLSGFNQDDLSTRDRDIAYLTGVSYAGMTPL